MCSGLLSPNPIKHTKAVTKLGLDHAKKGTKFGLDRLKADAKMAKKSTAFAVEDAKKGGPGPLGIND
ncbi:hypothetical protein [Arenimonas sp.]|uniref:hypothetical protein n=1 Tax=Arenimonas sp. TaxID=1872635 RepID=UPI0039E284AE